MPCQWPLCCIAMPPPSARSTLHSSLARGTQQGLRHFLNNNMGECYECTKLLLLPAGERVDDDITHGVCFQIPHQICSGAPHFHLGNWAHLSVNRNSQQRVQNRRMRTSGFQFAGQ